MVHLVYCDNKEKVLEKILDGSKTMVVRGAAGRKIPHSRVFDDEILYFMKKGSKKGCCKDEHKVIKTDNYQKTDVTKIPTLQSFTLALPPQPFVLETEMLASRVKQLPYSNAPPDRSTVPLYIRNCVYRI